MWEAKGFVRAEMTKYHAGTLIERVHLDFLGPLPQLGSEISMFWSPSKWIASPYPLRWQMSLPRPLQISQTKGATLKMKTICSCVWPSAAYLYRVKIKSAAMVDNYSHLKKCADQGISLWLARYREKFWKWVSVPQESTGVSRWEWVPAPL